MKNATRFTLSSAALFGAALLVASPALAEPGGCIKYGAAGAVAGHVANHHSVLGALGGCAVGMYRRHEYRKSVAEKAALWDKEHPGDANAHWWQSHHDANTNNQKAEWYDQEHPADSTPPGQTVPAVPPGR